MAPQVHWHEGLFLQPHHLQEAARHAGDALASERRLRLPYPYGVIEARLSADALENMQIRFDRLRVVMESGLEVDFPSNADLPALDIKRAYAAGSASFLVGLGVPLYQEARANTVDMVSAGADPSRVKRIFRVAEVQRADENTGENRQAMLVRRVNARLVIEGDDLTDLEVIPLLRVAHGADEAAGLPRQDPSWVPPCLVVGASPVLRVLVRDLTNFIETRRKDAVARLAQGGFAAEALKGVQVVQLLRLQILNRFAARLGVMTGSGAGAGSAGASVLNSLPPLEVYTAMRECLAELAGLHPDRDPWDAPRYDHDNPLPAFEDLDRRIRQLSTDVSRSNYLEVKLVREGAMMVGQLEDKHVSGPNEYFLGVLTKMDPIALAKLVEDPDRFKMMPKSMANMRLFGVKLVLERFPPLELPSRPGLIYFRLVRAETPAGRWDRILQERALAVRWPELDTLEFSDMSIYMTVP
jgi:type VI secretion system ImpJ/VasE family protein